jgi:hypothetical protein
MLSILVLKKTETHMYVFHVCVWCTGKPSEKAYNLARNTESEFIYRLKFRENYCEISDISFIHAESGTSLLSVPWAWPGLAAKSQLSLYRIFMPSSEGRAYCFAAVCPYTSSFRSFSPHCT